jgi:hypothetical protein
MKWLDYRSNALQGLGLVKDFPPNHWSKDDIENWAFKQYLKHYCPACEKQKAICICESMD